MKKTRSTELQIVKILREADAAPVVDVARRPGHSDLTIYAWRKRLGRLDPEDVERAYHPEQENRNL